MAEGDLVLEATYDQGDTDFKINKPLFWEFWAQYRRGDLVVDAIVPGHPQRHARRPWPGPFTGLTPFPADDAKLGSSGQGIVHADGRATRSTPQSRSRAASRFNRWSGAYAVITTPAQPARSAQWNNMFNVDWGGTLNGVPNPGYSASSTDFLLGLRYRMGQVDRLHRHGLPGQGQHRQPERTRARATRPLFNTVGPATTTSAGRCIVYGLARRGCHYGQTGPVADVDARQRRLHRRRFPGGRSGNWVGIGAVFVF